MKADGHLCAGEVLAGDADALADQLRALLENAVRAAADVFRGDARQFRVAHRQRDGQLAVRAARRPHAEADEVVPVERRQPETSSERRGP